MSDAVLSSSRVGELVREAVEGLSDAGVSNAAWEAREMMAAVLKEAAVLVPLRFQQALTAGQRAMWDRMTAERRARKPLSQVLGEWNFGELKLAVTPSVLTPRPETEELFAWAAARLPGKIFSVADIGTGSGCLAVALAKTYPDAFVWAVDVSPSALAVARRNAQAQKVSGRTFFLEGDLMSRLPAALYLDAVVANLPYVDEKDMGSLSPEVRSEPALALNGGREGLELIRRLVVQAWEKLPLGGRVFLEVGHDQAAMVAGLFRDMGYASVETGRDFAGIERFVMGVK